MQQHEYERAGGNTTYSGATNTCRNFCRTAGGVSAVASIHTSFEHDEEAVLVAGSTYTDVHT